MNQQEAVKAHLKSKKPLTSLQAIRLYGCTRLSAVVFKLRDAGMKIKTISKSVKTRYGKKTMITEYFCK